MTDIKIILEDGTEYHGKSFGYQGSAAGELVFSTAMTGYPESLTDPSYKGQILVMTYPLAGNYGVPCNDMENGIPKSMESDSIHVSALVVTDYTGNYSHWAANKSLNDWMVENHIPGAYSVDTRELTRHIRENGSLQGKLIYQDQDIPACNPCEEHLVDKVSCKEKIEYGHGAQRILLVDCGVKNNIIRDLVANDLKVIRVPWNYDFLNEEYDGLLISGGPGDPKKCDATIQHVAKALQRDQPILGIGLGGLIMGLAAGADTFKLKYGHHGHNQPVKQVENNSAMITSQNHLYAINPETLPDDWVPYYINLNDGTNEGFRHKSKPFFAVQFHHEPSGAPPDKEKLFEAFMGVVRK